MMNGAQAVSKYLEQKTRQNKFTPSTARQKGYLLRSWMDFVGAEQWQDFSLDDAIEWTTVPNSADGKHTRASCVKAFYAHAYRQGWTPTDLGKAVEGIEGSGKMPKPCPDAVLISALATARPDIADAMRIGRYAGLRVQEIAGVHRDHLVRGQLLVPEENAKGGRERWVPAHPEVERIVGRRDGYVFRSNSAYGHVTPGAMSKWIRLALPDPWTAHTLRHAFATDFYEATRDLVLTAKVLGHAKTATTERYVRPQGDASSAIRGMRLVA